MPNNKIRIFLVALALAAPVSHAQEVGKFAVVQNDVTSLKSGASQPVPAAVGNPIVLNESEITGRASRAKLVFGEGAVISIGQNTTFAVSQQAVDQATGASTSKVDVAEGKLRVFVSRFWGGRPKVEVNTPTAVVGIKGSEVLIEVFDGKTTVTVFSGEAEVRSKTGGATTTLTTGQQVNVTESGTESPIVVNAPILATLWELTEPLPEPPVEFPPNFPVRNTPVLQDDMSPAVTDCLTCSGTTTLGDPAVEANRDAPSAPGRPVNSGNKAGRR